MSIIYCNRRCCVLNFEYRTHTDIDEPPTCGTSRTRRRRNEMVQALAHVLHFCSLTSGFITASICICSVEKSRIADKLDLSIQKATSKNTAVDIGQSQCRENPSDHSLEYEA